MNNNVALFDKVCIECSRNITNSYSTSFSLGVRLLGKSLQDPIHAIYGFVRFADEIVDTFHEFKKEELLLRFKQDTYQSIAEGISLNPVLQSFQQVVNKYQIDKELIDCFLRSMEMDLDQTHHDQGSYEDYILGSAEVVGLMCLKVFVNGNQEEYLRLKTPAMKLGSAFQKINFLRDLQADYVQLGRTYFPGVNISKLNEETKREIEADIEIDFKAGYEGILQLPKEARLGVYIAYIYYYRLFQKIKNTPSEALLKTRIRIPNQKKYSLFVTSYLRHSLNLL
ncbi:MAG: phytoene/squalene synthase family protein [Luteibaculaceae bacterium]